MKNSIPMLRDVATLLLGSAGMTHELFLVPQPNMVRVWLSIGCLLGPTALYAVWRLRNPEPPPTPTAAGPSSPLSSSPPPGS